MTGDFSIKGESNNDIIDIQDNDYDTTEIKEQNICLKER